MTSSSSSTITNINSIPNSIIILLLEVKYAELARAHIFMPVAFEALGSIGVKATDCLSELCRRISAATHDLRDVSYLFQRVSVAIQRFNGVCFRGSFIAPPDTES